MDRIRQFSPAHEPAFAETRTSTPRVREGVSEEHHQKMLALAETVRSEGNIDPALREQKVDDWNKEKVQALADTNAMIGKIEDLFNAAKDEILAKNREFNPKQMDGAIRKYFAKTHTVDEPLGKKHQELQNEFKELQAKIVPDLDNKIRQQWDEIVKNDREDSQPPMDASEQIKQRDLYRLSVRDWLHDPQSLQQIALQNYQLKYEKVSILDMEAGVILVRKETLPKSAAHARTLDSHLGSEHNGIVNNQGHVNDFHTAVWIGAPIDAALDEIARLYDVQGVPRTALLPLLKAEVSDILKTGRATTLPMEAILKQIGEARGGKGTTNAMRVLNHSIQAGDYWAYEKLPGAAAIATISAMKENLRYSTSVLGATMYRDKRFRVLDEGAKKDIKKSVTDLAANSELGDTNETNRYRRERERENENIDPSVSRRKGVTRVGGESCSSYTVRLYQSAALQVALYEHLEEKVQEFDSMHGLDRTADLSDPDSATREKLDAVRSEMEKIVAPKEDGSLNDYVDHFLDGKINALSGLVNNSAEGVSPRTVEHFSREQKFLGVLTITEDDVFAAEEKFESTGASKSGGSALHRYQKAERSRALGRLMLT